MIKDKIDQLLNVTSFMQWLENQANSSRQYYAQGSTCPIAQYLEDSLQSDLFVDGVAVYVHNSLEYITDLPYVFGCFVESFDRSTPRYKQTKAVLKLAKEVFKDV